MIEIRESGFRVPVKSWLPPEEIEPGAMEQIRNTANHPEATGHVAVMADCHQGFGVTIGTVFATEGSIVPNAVGVDIGCGVAAVDTGIALDGAMDGAFWRAWADRIRRLVPVGFNVHPKPAELPDDLRTDLRATELQPLMEERAPAQFGTLGGGNHFLEAAADERGVVWLLVHSGSRGTGNKIAGVYHALAVEQSRARDLDAGKDLSSLALDTQEAMDYVHDMTWAEDFARGSRQAMLRVLSRVLGYECRNRGLREPGWENVHDVSHNYAVMEAGLVLHRKGATFAADGAGGVIPGTMGSASYVVRGKAGEDSWFSASHGAGRTMSRTKARKQITEDAMRTSLVGTHTDAAAGLLDEAPGAYKDIDAVMARQGDLVDVIHALRPIITVKGDAKARDD